MIKIKPFPKTSLNQYRYLLKIHPKNSLSGKNETYDLLIIAAIGIYFIAAENLANLPIRTSPSLSSWQ